MLTLTFTLANTRDPPRYLNLTFTACTSVATAGAYGVGAESLDGDGTRGYRAGGTNLPWCATSLNEDGTVHEWRYCRSDIVGFVPENNVAGSRRWRRTNAEASVTPSSSAHASSGEGGSVTCTSNGGSFSCVPTSSPTHAPTPANTDTIGATHVFPDNQRPRHCSTDNVRSNDRRTSHVRACHNRSHIRRTDYVRTNK